MDKPSIRVAVLDMYNRHPNQGMRGIRSLLYLESKKIDAQIRWHVFDVRSAEELPDDSYDIYISSGGPGSPLESNDLWEKKYFRLMDHLWNFNLKNQERKKHVFFICHSFQLICRHWNVGKVTKRHRPAFGIFPVHKTEAGLEEPLFENLPEPFYATDSREYQVIQPNTALLDVEGFKILALEKIRPHVQLERALMAVRFSDEFIGTQFHPEADPHGMIRYFTQPDKKEAIIKNYGEEKYYKMIDMLDDPEKIVLTQKTVLPTFLRIAFDRVLQAEYV
ncbi:MAG TPA: GMP synthase [Chitinophagales bacterium]|nr:GMP synthase [Chitinophagales bacterium]